MKFKSNGEERKKNVIENCKVIVLYCVKRRKTAAEKKQRKQNENIVR